MPYTNLPKNMSSVKTKIRLGTVFLFVLVMLSGGVGIYHLAKLRVEGEDVLKANYESLQYVQQMDVALDSIRLGGKAYADSFSRFLKLQERNLTEPGEREATATLRGLVPKLAVDEPSRQQARTWLRQVVQLNMQAIEAKSAASEAAAGQAVTIIVTTVAVI